MKHEIQLAKNLKELRRAAGMTRKDLAQKINDATAELVKDGTLDKIAKKYDLAASLISNQE